MGGLVLEANLYDELARVEHTHWWFRARRRIVWSLVDRYADRKTGGRRKVCELGCGTGGNLIGKAEHYDVVGVECSDHALQHARRVLGNRVQYGRLPDEVNLPRTSYDVVLLTDVLEHIEDDATSARTALDLLRPGGIVVATVPAYQWLYSPRDALHHHFRRYGKQQFAKLWHSGEAETLVLSHYNTLLFAPAAAVRVASKFIGSSNQTGDLKVPPRLINSALSTVMAAESSLLGRVTMPFGLSLVAVVQKRYAIEHARQVAA